MAQPPITIGPFTNVPAPGSPIRSDWAQQITAFVLGVRIDGGMATVAAAIMAAPGVVLNVPAGAVLAYPTRMYVTAALAIGSDSAPMAGAVASVLTNVAGTNQAPGPPVGSSAGGQFAAIPLVWSWAVPANGSPQYALSVNWGGGVTGTKYAAADTTWQRYRQ